MLQLTASDPSVDSPTFCCNDRYYVPEAQHVRWSNRRYALQEDHRG